MRVQVFARGLLAVVAAGAATVGACDTSAPAGGDGGGACPITGDCAADQEVAACIQIEASCNGIDDSITCGCQGRIDVKGGCLRADQVLTACIDQGPCQTTCSPATRNACFDTYCAAHPTDADCVCIRGLPPAMPDAR